MRYQYKREPLNTDEQAALVAACRTAEEKLVIWSLLDTGMRVSELAGLTKHSIDYQTHRLMFHGKGNKRRVLQLSPRLRELLEPWLISNECFGKSDRTIERIVKRVANHAAIRRVTCPHVLRHTWATNALRSGVNIVTIQKWLGHENINTTMLYLNFSPDDVLAEVAAKMW